MTEQYAGGRVGHLLAVLEPLAQLDEEDESALIRVDLVEALRTGRLQRDKGRPRGGSALDERQSDMAAYLRSLGARI